MPNRFQFGLSAAAGRSTVVPPKTSVTVNDRIATSVPTGSRIGTSHQSLPYTVANATSSIRPRSCGAASIAPMSNSASSISQNRGVGMPPNRAGVGTHAG